MVRAMNRHIEESGLTAVAGHPTSEIESLSFIVVGLLHVGAHIQVRVATLAKNHVDMVDGGPTLLHDYLQAHLLPLGPVFRPPLHTRLVVNNVEREASSVSNPQRDRDR
jgi:hypothetical protein